MHARVRMLKTPPCLIFARMLQAGLGRTLPSGAMHPATATRICRGLHRSLQQAVAMEMVMRGGRRPGSRGLFLCSTKTT
jgi:hypothetical protein